MKFLELNALLSNLSAYAKLMRLFALMNEMFGVAVETAVGFIFCDLRDTLKAPRATDLQSIARR